MQRLCAQKSDWAKKVASQGHKPFKPPLLEARSPNTHQFFVLASVLADHKVRQV